MNRTGTKGRPMMQPTRSAYTLLAGFLMLIPRPTLTAAGAAVTVDGKNIRVEFDSKTHSRVVGKFDGKETALGDFGPSEWLVAGGTAIQDFTLTGHKVQTVRD